jgi:large subunit ribosomal protein L32
MRNTSGHAGNRRSHHALKNITIVKDKESGNLRLPHRLDEATGMYRGKQVFAPKAKRTHGPKVKGPDTEPTPKEHLHEHAKEVHTNAEVKASKGVLGKIAGATRPKARSGFGGGV